MYVWIVTWDNRPTEVYYGDKTPMDILQDDLDSGAFLENDIELRRYSFLVDDYCHGELVRVK